MKSLKAKGTLESISPEQQSMVQQLKRDFAEDFLEFPEMCTTYHILRFLRAREFNYGKTKTMLNNFFAFRRKKDFKRISAIDMFSEKMKYIQKNYTSAHYGTDKQGRIIVVEKVSNFNYHMFDVVTHNDFEDYLIQRYERMLFIEYPLSSQAYQKRIDHTFLLVDLKGVDVVKIFGSKLKAIVKIATYITQDNYPELLGVSFFVNTPMIFKAIWAIIAVWLDKRTTDKFHFESGNGLSKLSALLDTDLLPAELGGKNTIPINQGFGLWTDELNDSYKNKTFFLKDREIERKYYYTDEERSGINKTTESQFFEKPSTIPKKHENLKASSIQEIKVSQFRVSMTPVKRSFEAN